MSDKVAIISKKEVPEKFKSLKDQALVAVKEAEGLVVVDNDSDKVVRSHATNLRSMKSSTEEIRKNLKAPLLELGKEIDDYANEIKDILQPRIDELSEQYQAYAKKKEEEKAEKERIERERIEKITSAIHVWSEKLRDQIQNANTLADLQPVKKALAEPMNPDFLEFEKTYADKHETIRMNLNRRTQELQEMEDLRKQKEEADRKRKIENELIQHYEQGFLARINTCETLEELSKIEMEFVVDVPKDAWADASVLLQEYHDRVELTISERKVKIEQEAELAQLRKQNEELQKAAQAEAEKKRKEEAERKAKEEAEQKMKTVRDQYKKLFGKLPPKSHTYHTITDEIYDKLQELNEEVNKAVEKACKNTVKKFEPVFMSLLTELKEDANNYPVEGQTIQITAVNQLASDMNNFLDTFKSLDLKTIDHANPEIKETIES